MSLSNQNEGGTKNPAKKFLQWKGGVGEWEYYDKEAGKKISISDKLYVVPLDDLATIVGWHDESQSGIYSNEVKNLREEELNVRAFKGGEIVKGLYSDIKGRLEGGKFARSVYAALLDSKGNVVELINLSISGGALGPWIDAGVDVNSGKIVVLGKNPTEQKKGATKYYIPTVTVKDKRDDILAECVQMDEDLQEYLGRYRGVVDTSVNSEKEPAPMPAMVEEEDDSDDLPF